MAASDMLVPTRQLTETCARCHHTAGQHRLGAVRSWEYCQAPDCLCPGWCSTLECATCDHGTPRWAGYAQCLACLDYRVLPSDYVYKSIVGFDSEAAIAEIRKWRAEWEWKHYGFELTLDRQHLFPESTAPSKYADRHTTLGRKLYYSRWVVQHRRKRMPSKDIPACLTPCDSPSSATVAARKA